MAVVRWERVASVSALLFVVVLVAVSVVSPTTPGAEDSGAEIAGVISDQRGGVLMFGCALGLMAGLFLVFGTALSRVLARAEADPPGASSLVAAATIATSMILLLSQAVLVATVYAADHGREPAAIGALYELSTPLYSATAVPLALFLGAAAASVIPSRALPAWLGWLAAALALCLFVSLPSIFSEAEGGGVFGAFFGIGELGTLVWVTATGIVLLRGARRRDQRHPGSDADT